MNSFTLSVQPGVPGWADRPSQPPDLRRRSIAVRPRIGRPPGETMWTPVDERGDTGHIHSSVPCRGRVKHAWDECAHLCTELWTTVDDAGESCGRQVPHRWTPEDASGSVHHRPRVARRGVPKLPTPRHAVRPAARPVFPIVNTPDDDDEPFIRGGSTHRREGRADRPEPCTCRTSRRRGREPCTDRRTCRVVFEAARQHPLTRLAVLASARTAERTRAGRREGDA